MTQAKQTKPEQWTEEQWQAITERGQNVLVAAAAGSGKTSVLVERIIRRITDSSDPIGVDQLLVVTFTNAAAAEMRHRIGDALRKALQAEPHSAHLRRQLVMLQRATITTIHSFCLGLLRQYYYLVDLDPDFRITDQMEAELLRQDVLEGKMEKWYEQDVDFHALADSMLDGQDDDKLANLILRLFDFSRSHPQPNRWLEQAAEMFDVQSDQSISSLAWVKSMMQSLRLELRALEASMSKAVTLASSPEGPEDYLPLLEQEKEAVVRACRASNDDWEALEQAVAGIVFQKLPNAKDVDQLIKKQVQDLRNSVKDKLKKLNEEYFLTSSEQYQQDLRKTAPYVRTLARLVIEYDEAFQQEKRSRSVVDFSDLEHLALRILTLDGDAVLPQPSEIARQFRQQFAEVLVDEYQDINLVQETILRMVSRDVPTDGVSNRFMVGDVKQSIYRFRLAEPNLFLDKYQTYGIKQDTNADGIRIDLAANFRSRREVVDAVNYLFRQIMSPGVGEISYDQSAELIGRAAYPNIEPERLQVEVHLVDRNSEGADEEREDGGEDQTEQPAESDLAEEASVAQLEARLIAKRIRSWMQPGEGDSQLLVYDKKEGGLRPLAYRDIVILLRATASWGQTMLEELRAANIPVYSEQNAGYFDATEVEVMLSLLRVIDNPLQDISLAAVLRSPIVGIREDQLAQIRIHYPNGPFYQAVFQYLLEQATDEERWHQKLRIFYRDLNIWRTRARQGSLAELIAQIYRDTGYLDYLSTFENGQQRKANLRALYDRAKQYEATSYRGLFRFLRFVDRLQESGNDLGEARTISENEDVVRIMTIHKSKGLEFPVVFVAGLGKQFNTLDTKSSFLLHKNLGFGPQVVDGDLHLRYPSLAALGIKQQLRREMLAEEMRVLYVALTRAREKLLLVGSAKDLAKSVNTWGNQTGEGDTLADEDLIQAKGYLDWVGRSLLRHPLAGPLRSFPLERLEGAEPIDLRTIPDDSRWSFHFYQVSDLSAQSLEQNELLPVWQRMINREQITERPTDEVSRVAIEQKLTWRDPNSFASQTAAKWIVSDLKQRKNVDRAMLHKLPSITRKPRFLTTMESHRFTGAEVGTIMHLVMQHLKLHGELDQMDIAQQLAGLVERQFITEEQAEAVNVAQIASFFATPIGQRMKRAVVVHQELPFTMALQATEVDGRFEQGEQIIVQGVIDCLLEEGNGQLTLIDFKTDWIEAEPSPAVIEQLTERYAEQIRLYAEAVKSIWKRDVQECYLYLFAGGFVIRMDKGL